MTDTCHTTTKHASLERWAIRSLHIYIIMLVYL